MSIAKVAQELEENNNLINKCLEKLHILLLHISTTLFFVIQNSFQKYVTNII